MAEKQKISVLNYKVLKHKKQTLLEIREGSFYFREYEATDTLKDFSLQNI